MKRYTSLFNEAEEVPRDEMNEFITIINKIIEKVSTFKDSKLDRVASLLNDELTNNLDKSFIREIDKLIGGMKKIDSSAIRDILYALEIGRNKEGTEPRAAINGAISFLQIFLRKI